MLYPCAPGCPYLASNSHLYPPRTPSVIACWLLQLLSFCHRRVQKPPQLDGYVFIFVAWHLHSFIENSIVPAGPTRTTRGINQLSTILIHIPLGLSLSKLNRKCSKCWKWIQENSVTHIRRELCYVSSSKGIG